MSMRQPYAEDYERAEEFQPVSRPGITRTGRPSVPAPLMPGDNERAYAPRYVSQGSAQMTPYRQVARQAPPTRRAAYVEPRQRFGNPHGAGVIDRTLSLPFKTRIGAMVLLLLVAALVIYTFITVMFQGFNFVRDGATFGFFNNGAHIVQLDSYVGHNETTGQPTKFVAMNLNRQVTVLEFPGGDPNKTQVIVGPYLYGQGEDKVSVTVRLSDLNGDGKPDLIVTAKGEDTVFINDGNKFRPMTADERAKLATSTAAGGSK